MRAVRRLGKVGLTLVITAVFLAVSSLPRFAPRAYATDPAPPSLPVPEDPLGQQPETQTPEISLDVDVRDGHLTIRLVDIWGPGRAPLVMRTFLSTATAPTSGLGEDKGQGSWYFNYPQELVIVPLESGGPDKVVIREADASQWVYKYSSTRTEGNVRIEVYTRPYGTASTVEISSTCINDPGGPQQPQPLPSPLGGRGPLPRPTPAPIRPRGAPIRPMGVICTWFSATQFLPKGVVRTYASNPVLMADPNALRPGLIQQVRDANGNVATYTWTTFSNQIRAYIATIRDPVNRQTQFAYDPSRFECVLDGEMGCALGGYYYRVRTVTDPYGRQATYAYNGNGQLASVTNPAGRTTSYTYNAQYFQLLGVTNARGNTTTITGYGAVVGGPPLQVTAPDGSTTTYTGTLVPPNLLRRVVTNARGYATTYEISRVADENYNGNITRMTDPLGNVTQYTYDARHNLTEVVDARGNHSTFEYNSRNKVTRVVRAAGTLNLTTTATWDTNDNQLTLTNPRGIRTEYTYDSHHNLTQIKQAAGTADESTTQYIYNTWGGITQLIDPRSYTTAYTYTAHRQVQTSVPPIGGTVTFTYDAFDDQVTKTDGSGHTWATAYEARRLVTTLTDPLNNQVRHEYDNNGNHRRTYDAKNQLTVFAYDNRDRLTTITDPLNGQTLYQYDLVSNLTQITNARGYATVFTYDAANRLTQIRDALNQTTTSQYDQVGNRTQMTDRKGQTQTFTYDQANRLTQVTGGGQTIAYTYDTDGNRLTLVDSTGTTAFQYDNLDRLTRTTYPDTKTVQATYDRAGNRITLTNPGGLTTTAVYDQANRLAQMTQSTLTWTFAYDPAGNRTTLTHPNGTSVAYAYLNNNWLQSITDKAPGGATFQSTAYTYDQNGNRLTQADPSGTTTFTYDADNRLTQAAYPSGYGTWSWLYDAMGNRTQQTAPGGTTNYTYDQNNRLTQAGTSVYTYDNNGNLTAISTGQAFTWDVFNRMTQATGPGGTVTHTYNGDGLKTRRVGPDGTRNYYYDGIRALWEADGAGQMTAQYDRDIFGNLLSRLESGGARRYYHFDGLGSTTALTNETGAATSTLLYDAWGNQRAATGSDQGRYRFTGAELDTATGLYHMGARFYDPTIGRWLSEDPVQDKPFEPAALNFYAYVADNPVNLLDPRGTEFDGGGGGPSSSIGDLVLGWILGGMDATEATKRLVDLWGKINAIIDALNATGEQLNFGMLVFLAGFVSTTPKVSGQHWHHVWPKYLGGPIVGTKILMDAKLHQAYHGFLDRSGLARRNAGELAQMIRDGRLGELLNKLLDATQKFDKLHGSSLYEQLLAVLRQH